MEQRLRCWRRWVKSRASATAITPQVISGWCRRRDRQSADHCYHGHITKTGDANARWMLTQGVQHIANHPGPLGVFFRRLCKRKNRNVAISAVARKLVTIAFLMLKNKEPYRYAVAKRFHEKFTHLRTIATRKAAKPVEARPATLPAACAVHNLPPIRTFPNLPAGESKMLHERRIEGVVRAMHGVKPKSGWAIFLDITEKRRGFAAGF